VKIQYDYECIFLHRGSARHHRVQDPKELRSKIVEIAALSWRRHRPQAVKCDGAIGRPRACGAGLDADFVTPVGWLERMTQYKVKSDGAGIVGTAAAVSLLMAADILLYQADDS